MSNYAAMRCVLIMAICLVMSVGTVRPSASMEVGLGLHAGADNSLDAYEQFGKWLGRKVLYRIVFCDPTKWEGIAHPYFLDASEKWLKSDPARWEVLSVPLLPENAKGDFQSIISGSHDAEFRSLASHLTERGLAARTILRLGWEFNGDWFAWSAVQNPAGYRAAFRRAVRVLREKAPGLKIDWCANRGSSKGMRWTDAYPGDDVVDIVSMDVYDHYNAGWDDLVHSDAGLQALRDFAQARHKQEAYPEWGCSTDSHGHGDSPAFIEHITDWLVPKPPFRRRSRIANALYGDRDDTVPLNQSELFAAALKKAGVKVTFHMVKGAGHGFGGEEIDAIVDAFFDKHLKSQ